MEPPESLTAISDEEPKKGDEKPKSLEKEAPKEEPKSKAAVQESATEPSKEAPKEAPKAAAQEVAHEAPKEPKKAVDAAKFEAEFIDEDEDDDGKPAGVAGSRSLVDTKNLSQAEQLKLSVSKIETNLEKAEKALTKQKENVKELE